jgi:hypothetical protein
LEEYVVKTVLEVLSFCVFQSLSLLLNWLFGFAALGCVALRFYRIRELQ